MDVTDLDVETSRIAILGAPLDLGASRRGVDMGPSSIRYSGLAERMEELGGDVVDLGNVKAAMPEIAPVQDESARYLKEILATCSQIGHRVAEILRSDRFPLVLGGDHSIAMGTLAGLHSVHGTGGVLWVDAHGDINTPENSPSGNVHGMPLAAALGACGFDIDGFGPPPWVDPARTALVGVRSLDTGEKQLVSKMGIKVLTMSEIDRRGVGAVMKEALDHVAGDGFVHVSFDVDVLDPKIAPGVGTPVRGGITYREAHLAMELIAESGIATSLEIVEVNPIYDLANATGALAVELVASALGARII
ncbi:MAG: arginase [Actinomycetota bacterium]|nr:arginase [Actinomycetota bacterium]